jgi:glycogen synthase
LLLVVARADQKRPNNDKKENDGIFFFHDMKVLLCDEYYKRRTFSITKYWVTLRCQDSYGLEENIWRCAVFIQIHLQGLDKWNDIKLTAKLKGADQVPATDIPDGSGRDLPSSRGQTI